MITFGIYILGFLLAIGSFMARNYEMHEQDIHLDDCPVDCIQEHNVFKYAILSWIYFFYHTHLYMTHKRKYFLKFSYTELCEKRRKIKENKNK